MSTTPNPTRQLTNGFLGHDGRSQYNLVPKYKGAFSALSHIYKTEGLSGLYKGTFVNFFLINFSNLTYFSM